MATIIVTPETLVAAVRGELQDIFEQVSDAVESTIRLGETTVKEYISTRGTAKSGKAGRIETGAMLRSVRSKKLAFTTWSARGVFGMGNAPHYAIYQELGFTHNRSGAWVEGMFAVVDAREVAKNYLAARIAAVR